MFMTILTILTIVADIGVGFAAYKLARTVEKNQHGHDAILINHEDRIKALEARCGR